MSNKVTTNYFKANEHFIRYELHKKEDDSVQTVVIEENNHHVVSVDVSGSMWGEMDSVKSTLKHFARAALKVGDTLTIYKFNHDFELILKHQLITSVDESFFVQFIDYIIEKELFAGGMTNFVGPVNNMADIDLVGYMKRLNNMPIKGYFMSDGGDNMSGGRTRILDAFSRIKPFIKIGNFQVQGFGDYYDKNLLTAIAKHMNGIFVHVNNSKEYYNEILSFSNNKASKEVTKITIKDYGDFTFVINDADGSIIEIEQGKLDFNIEAESFIVVTATKNRPTDCKIVATLNGDEIKVALGAAVVASRNNLFDLGVEILSENVKDLYFAELLYSSQSQISFAKAEKEIQTGIKNEAYRYLEGKGKFLKNPNQISLIEILQRIAEDDNVELETPRSYSPITFRPIKITTREDGTLYPKFVPDVKDWVKFNEKSFVYNKDSVNLSIQFYQPGSVTIDQDDVFKHNLQPIIKNLSKYNNYTVVGFLGDFCFKDEKGIPSIRIRNISLELYNWLVNEKVIRKNTKYEVGKEFRLNLQKFPIIKKSEVKDISTVDYGKLIAKQQNTSIENKIYKYFLNQNDVEEEMELRFGEEEAAVLKERYLIDNKGNFKSKGQDLTTEIAKSILTEVKFDIDKNLPFYTTKAKAGIKKTFEDLSVPELKELLLIAGIIDMVEYPIFDGKLSVVNGTSFDTLPSMNKIKESLLFKNDFVFDYLKESNIPFDMPLTPTGKPKKPTIADKKEIFENAGIDLSLFKIETVIDSYIVSAKDKDKQLNDVDILKTFLVAFDITNSMEVAILNIFLDIYSKIKNMSEKEQIDYFTNKMKENKALLKEISNEKFQMKTAILLGGKGYSDQPNRLNPEPVKFIYDGVSYEYTPIIKDETAYLGSLDQIVKKYNIKY